MKKALLFFLLFGLLNPITGFSQYIKSVVIQYSNPGVSNNIQVIADLVIPSQPAFRTGYTSVVKNDTLFLTACYNSGPAAATKNIIDTLQIGALPQGNYTLFFKTHLASRMQQCDTTHSSVKILVFVVNQTLGLKPNFRNPEPIFYPNPATDILTLESSPLKQISLYDLSGKQIHTEIYRGETSVKMDISSMPKGIYFLEIIGRDGVISRKRLLKN